jgi:putative transposase
MKQVLTAKLKLLTDAAQFKALRATQLAYRDGLNYVSRYAYAHGKMSNKVRLQDGTYDELRARYKIRAQCGAANGARAARLGEYGAVVNRPRCVKR